MVEPISLENEIESQNQANMELLTVIESMAFEKFDFETDTILQRLPEGMDPTDTIESHKARCQENMTETHQFETRALAEKFIQVRFKDYKLKESTKDHKLYVCTRGLHEQCTGYAKLFLNLGNANVVRCCYGHYAHDTNIGQARFTGIQFATIRLYCDFYWKNIVGVDWNIHNLIYCFKQWYTNDHVLHYLNSYDIRAIATELRRVDAGNLKLTNGVYHSVSLPTAALSSSASSTTSEDTVVHNVSASNPNGEGTSGPPARNNAPTPLASKTSPAASSSVAPDADDDEDEDSDESLPSRSSSPNPLLASALTDWILDDSRFHLVIQMWNNILFYATELKNLAFMKSITPTSSMTEQDYNDAQQIFNMLNQASEIAQKMITKITEFKEQPERVSPEDYASMFRIKNCLFPTPGSPDPQSDDESDRGSTGVPEPGAVLDFGPNYDNPIATLIHDHWMNPNNPTIAATIRLMKEQDFQNYQHHMRTSRNVFAMPLPNGTYIPSRLYYMTGINLKKKMADMREVERVTFEEEVFEGMRANHVDEYYREESSESGESVEEEKKVTVQGNRQNKNLKNNTAQEEAPVKLTKNQKKKLKKKEKVRKAAIGVAVANAAAEAAAAAMAAFAKGKPLRHFNQ